MNNESGEPQVLEAEWDREQVAALFADLQQAAQIQHVQVRAAADSNRQDGAVSLQEAHELFNSGDAKAIQIRYQFEEKDWCDTLMVGPQTVRIIRTAS